MASAGGGTIVTVWGRYLVGFGGLAVLGVSCAVIPAQAGSQTLSWALAGEAGLAVMAYAWQRWWLVMAGAALTVLGTGLASGAVHLPVVATTALLGAIIGWWSRQGWEWPFRPCQALSAVGVLVAVSITLSALVALAARPVATHDIGAVVVLYLSTPPWEWAVVLTALVQGHSLGRFWRQNYAWKSGGWRHVGLGLAAGVGILMLTAVLVSLESKQFRVKANNPFVTSSALGHHPGVAALAVAVGVVLLAPVAEEALFRGILFGSLSHRWRYLPSTAISASIFGLAHLNLSLLLPLALAGLVFNALYRRTGSLIPSSIAHATLNGVSVAAALGMAGVLH